MLLTSGEMSGEVLCPFLGVAMCLFAVVELQALFIYSGYGPLVSCAALSPLPVRRIFTLSVVSFEAHEFLIVVNSS